MAAPINSFTLHWADILVLVAYFILVIGFGLWVSLGRDTIYLIFQHIN
jgi:hypothetical protein